jgi:hypothetical protein
MKRHINLKPYKCYICNSVFSRKNVLNTHISTHSGNKHCICTFPDCGKSFSTKGNMKTHLKRHYNKIKSDSKNSVCETITISHNYFEIDTRVGSNQDMPSIFSIFSGKSFRNLEPFRNDDIFLASIIRKNDRCDRSCNDYVYNRVKNEEMSNFFIENESFSKIFF